MKKEYLQLFSTINFRDLKLDYMFQSPKLPNHVFISPSILLGKLPIDIEIRIGRLIGKQLNLRLIGIKKSSYITLLCDDPKFLYTPYYAASDTESILIYKYTH